MAGKPPKPGGKYAPDFQEHRIGALISASGIEPPKGKVSLITLDWFGKTVGDLTFKGKKLHFTGKADKSAKMLFDILKKFVEKYIVERLELGPRDTKLSVPFNMVELIASNPQYFKTGLDSATSPILAWIRSKDRKPGDKFIVEITK